MGGTGSQHRENCCTVQQVPQTFIRASMGSSACTLQGAGRCSSRAISAAVCFLHGRPVVAIGQHIAVERLGPGEDLRKAGEHGQRHDRKETDLALGHAALGAVHQGRHGLPQRPLLVALEVHFLQYGHQWSRQVPLSDGERRDEGGKGQGLFIVLLGITVVSAALDTGSCTTVPLEVLSRMQPQPSAHLLQP